MKNRPVLVLLVGACASVALAQSHTATSAAHHKATATTHKSASAKLPAGIPQVHGVVKTAFALRYEDIKAGTGAPAEPNKLYTVQYTGWLAADGHKFDSSYDHETPIKDKDGMPVMGTDGKPKMGPPQPFVFPQGFHRVISGFDQGFKGMRVGGKRRLFIPWQLAYGESGRPGIPPKSDLIFDVELVSQSDLVMPANHPAISPGTNPMHPHMTLPEGHPHVTSGQPKQQ